jgi:hypothetical protein
MTQLYGEEKEPPGGSDKPVTSKEPAVPVYEAEIIDEEEFTGKDIVSQETLDAGTSVKKTERLSYRIGKMVGAAAAFLGIISEVVGAFRSNKRSAGVGRGSGGSGGGMGRRNGSGMGRGMNRGKGRGRRKRNFC